MTYNNKFFICLSCKKILCPLCDSNHDKEHNIIDYDEKYYICDLHYESYNSFCKDCKKDICIVCEKSHKNHDLIYYGNILPNKDKLNNNIQKLKIKIEEYKNDINEIINNLNDLKESFDIYYKIINNLKNSYEVKNRNYPILQNLNDVGDNIENFNNTIKNIITKFNSTLNLYNKINLKPVNDLNEDEKKIKLFEEKNIVKFINNENNNNLILKVNMNIEKKEENKIIYDENNNNQIIKDKKIMDVEIKINDNFKINLSYNYYFSYKIEEEKFNVNEIKVYNIINNTLDITFNLDKKMNEINDIIIMIDGNVILKGEKIHVIKVNEKSIEIIESIEANYSKIFKFSNNFIAVYQISSINFYEYEQGILIESNYKINIKEIIYEICEVNKIEIAIYCYESGILYGRTDFLIFYDIKNDKRITSFKVGEGKSTNKFLRLINKNSIILQHDTIFYLVDTIQRKIKKTINLYSDNLSTFVSID